MLLFFSLLLSICLQSLCFVFWKLFSKFYHLFSNPWHWVLFLTLERRNDLCLHIEWRPISEHSQQPPYSVKNQPKRGKSVKWSSHQTPQTGEKVKLMNSSSPKRGSYCSLLTELNKLFFSLLLFCLPHQE